MGSSKSHFYCQNQVSNSFLPLSWEHIDLHSLWHIGCSTNTAAPIIFLFLFLLKMVHSILEIPLGIHNFSFWRLTNLELYQKIPSLSPCQKYLSMLKITFNPSLKKRKFRSCRGVWGLVRTPFLLKILSFSPLTTPGRGLILLLATWNSEVHLVV